MSVRLQDITQMLQDVNAGREGAMDRLVAAVYDELRLIAARIMQREVRPGGHGATLGPTALVHEAFLKLVKERQKYDKRGHFFVAFTTCLQQVLKDYIRKSRAAKRGGKLRRTRLDPAQVAAPDTDLADFLDALQTLEKLDSRAADAAKLRLLCGLNNEEGARSLGISITTFERHWRLARRWLSEALDPGKA